MPWGPRNSLRPFRRLAGIQHPATSGRSPAVRITRRKHKNTQKEKLYVTPEVAPAIENRTSRSNSGQSSNVWGLDKRNKEGWTKLESEVTSATAFLDEDVGTINNLKPFKRPPLPVKDHYFWSKDFQWHKNTMDLRKTPKEVLQSIQKNTRQHDDE